MRFFALVTASLVVASATATFLACSSDPAPAAGSDGGSSSGSDGTSGGLGGPSDAGGTNPGATRCEEDAGDGGVQHAPNGCLLFTTNIRPAGKIASVARTDLPNAIAWTTPEGALCNGDNAGAQVTISEGQESQNLQVSDFGFDLPAGADVWGVVVELKRQTLTAGGVLQTAHVNITIPDPSQHPVETFDNADFYWPTKIIGTHPYGEEVDTWEVNLTQALVTTPDFGAYLSVKKDPDGGAQGPVTGMIDSLKLAVWYASSADPATCQK